jgi:hypothetical protein
MSSHPKGQQLSWEPLSIRYSNLTLTNTSVAAVRPSCFPTMPCVCISTSPTCNTSCLQFLQFGAWFGASFSVVRNRRNYSAICVLSFYNGVCNYGGVQPVRGASAEHAQGAPSFTRKEIAAVWWCSEQAVLPRIILWPCYGHSIS